MARQPRIEDREGEGRQRRAPPLGMARSKLQVAENKGYKRRWMNANEGRLHDALEVGYRFVEDPTLQIGMPDIDNVNRDLGSRVSRVVDKTTGQRAYLMEIKDEFYKEDQEMKVAEVEATDRRIRKGNLKSFDGMRVPRDGIKIETKQDEMLQGDEE